MLFLTLVPLSFASIVLLAGVPERVECRPCWLAKAAFLSLVNAGLISGAVRLVGGLAR